MVTLGIASRHWPKFGAHECSAMALSAFCDIRPFCLATLDSAIDHCDGARQKPIWLFFHALPKLMSRHFIFVQFSSKMTQTPNFKVELL